MRKVIWIFIALIWLIVAAVIGISYWESKPTALVQATKGYIAISQKYINGQDIDPAIVEGDSEDSTYVRYFADYLNALLKANRALTKQKNFLVILVQPRNLASSQAVDVALEKVQDYDAQIGQIYTDLQQAVAATDAKMRKLNNDDLKIFDVVSFLESLEKSEPETEKEFQQYLGLSQYVKAILEFTKSRVGYYDMDAAGNIVFSSPEDQQYYMQLVAGMNQYVKLIDDLNAQHNAEDRKNFNNLTSGG